MIHYQKRGVTVRDARIEDVDALKDRLREADAKEVIAVGETPESALRRSFSRSTMRFSVELEGANEQRSVVAMFGVVPDTILGMSACVWFLGAPEMNTIKKTFVKLSRQVIADFLAQYPLLWNRIDSRYVSSIRWIKSCGAETAGETMNLKNGENFVLFRIARRA